MSGTSTRATDQQRDRYVTLLCEAYARGQLTETEREERVVAATTVGVTIGVLNRLVADVEIATDRVEQILQPPRRRHTGVRHPAQAAAWQYPENYLPGVLRFAWRRVVSPLLLAVASCVPVAYFTHRWPGVWSATTSPAHVGVTMWAASMVAIIGMCAAILWAMCRAER